MNEQHEAATSHWVDSIDVASANWPEEFRARAATLSALGDPAAGPTGTSEEPLTDGEVDDMARSDRQGANGERARLLGRKQGMAGFAPTRPSFSGFEELSGSSSPVLAPSSPRVIDVPTPEVFSVAGDHFEPVADVLSAIAPVLPPSTDAAVPSFAAGPVADVAEQSPASAPTSPVFAAPTSPAAATAAAPAFDVPAFEVPSLDVPAFDLGAVPSAPAAPAFEVPSAPAFDIPATTAFDVPAAPAFGAPAFDLPAAPAFDVPAAPAFGVPAAPTFDVPAFDVAAPTAFDTPAIPAAPTFGVPATTAFDVPSFDAPAVPAFEVPAAPTFPAAATAPEAPAFDVPAFDVPAASAFDVPAFGTPTAPSAPVFDLAPPSMPTAPTFPAADASAFTLPTALPVDAPAADPLAGLADLASIPSAAPESFDAIARPAEPVAFDADAVATDVEAPTGFSELHADHVIAAEPVQPLTKTSGSKLSKVFSRDASRPVRSAASEERQTKVMRMLAGASLALAALLLGFTLLDKPTKAPAPVPATAPVTAPAPTTPPTVAPVADPTATVAPTVAPTPTAAPVDTAAAVETAAAVDTAVPTTDPVVAPDTTADAGDDFFTGGEDFTVK